MVSSNVKAESYYGSAATRFAPPPGMSAQTFRRLCVNPATRPAGAVKGPGRVGWIIDPKDWDRYLRTHGAPSIARTIEEAAAASLLAAGYR